MGSISVDDKQCGNSSQGRRIYLLTSPRTASNLFVKILNLEEQPDLVANSGGGGYFYMGPFMARDKFETWDVPAEQLPPNQKKAIGAFYQGATDRLKSFVDEVEAQGKTPFVKEHVNFMTRPSIQNQILHHDPINDADAPWTMHVRENDVHTSTNPLFLPDNWLKSFMPVFLIRHPALSFPSQYRAQADGRGESHSASRMALHTLISNYASVRQLYDFYRSYFTSMNPNSPWPLVIEAAEFITNPEPVMHHFCEVTGLDSSKLKFTWDVASKDQLEKLPSDVARRFLSTLNASTGILKEKANPKVDIDAEATKWKEEFGLKTGNKLEELVRDSLDDYEYVRSRRWTPPGLKESTA